MRAIKKEVNEKGEILLTCAEDYFFGMVTKKTQYIATEEYPKGYWNWRKMPDKTLLNDMLFFQLNSWCKDFD
jgi:hypothetical protein